MHQTLSTPVAVEVDVHVAGLRQWTNVSALEWRTVCERHCNILLEVREEATAAALLLLRPYLGGIAHWKQGTVLLEPPSRHVRTLILENVTSLRATEQTNLLTWLSAADQRIQIVSTTTQPLFPFVARGDFDEQLYYRLNTVLLHID